MRRNKTEIYALSIVGFVFTIMGSIFALLGVVLFFSSQDTDVLIVGQIYIPLGLIFLSLGVAFLYIRHRQKQERAQLIAAGHYIWGEIAEYTRNANICINGRYPYTVLVQHRASDGQVHIFRSRNLVFYPDRSILGKLVKVYVSDDKFSRYYVDILPALPQIIEH